MSTPALLAAIRPSADWLPKVPRNGMTVLDACCGAGGAAMGYYLAGFDVVGVDLAPQPNYPFPFHRADALEFVADHGTGFDVVHASWPCQRYSRATAWRGTPADHPDLVSPGRAVMQATGRPWVIENVPEAPLRADYVLCGTQFGLNVRRHRHFETSWGTSAELLPPCWHHDRVLPFEHKNERAYADAMGCTWMTNIEARQAIPPAYTHLIGCQALAQAGGPVPLAA